jgi:hypothetical protein
LRAAVEALLAAHEASGSLLDRPPPVPQGTTTDYHPPIAPGVVIAGRYSLVEKIGEGGMGEVWVAKQTEPVKRKVALKLIKPGMDSKAVLARFEQERQALALMDHAHIARVFDGGLTPHGRPFFVMELVNGLPLTKFCDEARLTPRERLESSSTGMVTQRLPRAGSKSHLAVANDRCCRTDRAEQVRDNSVPYPMLSCHVPSIQAPTRDKRAAAGRVLSRLAEPAVALQSDRSQDRPKPRQ